MKAPQESNGQLIIPETVGLVGSYSGINPDNFDDPTTRMFAQRHGERLVVLGRTTLAIPTRSIDLSWRQVREQEIQAARATSQLVLLGDPSIHVTYLDEPVPPPSITNFHVS